MLFLAFALAAAATNRLASVEHSAVHGIKGNGSDETVQLRAFLALVGPNQRLVFDPTPRAIRFTSPIEVGLPEGGEIDFSGTRLAFDGTTPSASGKVAALSFSGTGYTLIAPNLTCLTQDQEYNGLLLTRTANAKVEHPVVRNCRWAGIAIDDDVAGTSHDIVVAGALTPLNRFGIATNGARVTLLRPSNGYNWAGTAEAQADAGRWDDLQATGAISGTTLTVAAVAKGDLRIGTQLSGPGVPAGEKVVALGSGSGKAGTYQVSKPAQSSGQLWGSAYYDGVVVSSGASDTTIIAPDESFNGQSGIYAGAVKGLRIVGGTLNGNFNKGLDVGPGSGMATGISAKDVTIRGNRTGQVNLFKARGGRLENLRISDPTAAGGLLFNSGAADVDVIGGNVCSSGTPVFQENKSTTPATRIRISGLRTRC